MNVERYIRLIAGAFVLLSLALGYWVNQYWFLFTAFVGLNLLQSAFTNWCPMMTILRKAGVMAPGVPRLHRCFSLCRVATPEALRTFAVRHFWQSPLREPYLGGDDGVCRK